MSLTNEIISGAAAGFIGTTLGFPLEAIKTRLQTTGKGGSNTTMMQTARVIYGEGGILAFYRGLASPLLSLVILNTLNFSSYATLKDRFGVPADMESRNGRFSNSLRVALTAACVGPMAALISTPFEMLKIQMMLQPVSESSSSINSSISARSSSNGSNSNSGGAKRSSMVYAYNLVRKHGLRILYTGHTVNTAREIVFLSTYFTVYENVKSAFMHAISIDAVAVPLAGGFSGAAGWVISFPLDLVKANVQGFKYVLPTDRPPSSISVATHLLRTKGFFGLYSGVVPSIVRAFLVSSSRFSAYECSMWLLNDAPSQR